MLAFNDESLLLRSDSFRLNPSVKFDTLKVYKPNEHTDLAPTSFCASFLQESLSAAPSPSDPMSSTAVGRPGAHFGGHASMMGGPGRRTLPSPSVMQHRVVADRKWALGLQVKISH